MFEKRRIWAYKYIYSELSFRITQKLWLFRLWLFYLTGLTLIEGGILNQLLRLFRQDQLVLVQALHGLADWILGGFELRLNQVIRAFMGQQRGLN